MLFEADVNYLAVVLGGIAAQPIGALWYSKGAFGGAWMRLRGYTEEDVSGGGATGYVIGLFAALLVAYVLARLVDMVGADSVLDCIAVAAFAWLGFAATVQATGIAFSKTRSVELFGIEGGYWLASYIAIGAIVGAFQ